MKGEGTGDCAKCPETMRSFEWDVKGMDQFYHLC